MVDTLSEEREALYGRALKGVLERDTRIRESGVPAEAVAAKVEVGLRSRTPKPEYKVGISPRLSTLSSLPPSRVDESFISMLKSESGAEPAVNWRRRTSGRRADPGRAHRSRVDGICLLPEPTETPLLDQEVPPRRKGTQ